MPNLLEPSGQQGHIIPLGVIFNSFAQVRVRPSDDHIFTLEPGHNSYSILAATPDRYLHSQLDVCLAVNVCHGPAVPSSKKCRRIPLASKCHFCRIMFSGVLEPKAKCVYLPKDAKGLIHGTVPSEREGRRIDKVWLRWEASYFSI